MIVRCRSALCRSAAPREGAAPLTARSDEIVACQGFILPISDDLVVRFIGIIPLMNRMAGARAAAPLAARVRTVAALAREADGRRCGECQEPLHCRGLLWRIRLRT